MRHFVSEDQENTFPDPFSICSRSHCCFMKRELSSGTFSFSLARAPKKIGILVYVAGFSGSREIGLLRISRALSKNFYQNYIANEYTPSKTTARMVTLWAEVTGE